MMPVYFLLVFLWIAVDLCLTSGSYLVLAPNKLRLGTDHDVIIVINGLPQAESDFRLYLSSTHKPRFSETTFRVENGEARKVNVRVDVDDIPSPGDIRVVLTLESISGEIKHQTDIAVTRVSGYIFIQTDKPIYTPRQRVKYRIIALGEDQRWAPWRVQIDIINPRGIVVDRITQTPQDAFNGAEFPLSRDPMTGTWKISATYDDQVDTKNIITFDVMEYVLPRFGLTFSSSPATIYVEQEMTRLTLTVRAKYVYKQPVKGSVKLDILTMVNNVTCYLMTNLGGELDQSGRLQIHVDSATLAKTIEEKYDHCDNSDGYDYDPAYDPVQLEVDVTATENRTRHAVSKRFKSALVTLQSLAVEPVDFRNYYKPGVEYHFKVRIVSNGNPVGQRQVQCSVGDHTLQGTTTSSGIVQFVFMPPPGGSFKIEVTVDTETENFYLKQENTGLRRHISVYLDKPPKAGRPMKVTVRYSHPPGRYYLLVVTRGKIVYYRNCESSSRGQDKWTIPASFTREMSPLSRVVVVYIAMEGTVAEVIADSVVVRAGNTCTEELQLSVPTGGKPKATAIMKITGGPGMRVGLLAVDKAVYSIKFEKSLTRKLIFQEFVQHDLGRDGGTAIDALHTLQNSGFSVMTNADITFQDNSDFSHRTRPSDGDGDPSDQRLDVSDSKRLRSYFPESWLFQETTLSDTGSGSIDFVYPDSITTWVFQAVGVSADHGLCVSISKKVVVYRDFFVDLYLPYKVTRLENIQPKIAVANYKNFSLAVSVHISVDQGLCLPEGEDGNIHYEHVVVPANDMVVLPFSVIPVMSGDLAIDVRVGDVRSFDGVRKILHVVTEGEETEKTITFNLDPQGRARQAMVRELQTSGKLTFSEDTTVTHKFYTDLQEQYTDINMALPVETIPGSEKFQVLASGDLLGNVINMFITDSDDNDEEVIGENIMTSLSPTVLGLKYLIMSDDVDHDTVERGRVHIRNGIVNILKLRNDSGGFRYFDESAPSTWFTAFVLQTLCVAKDITFVNREVIDTGLTWLFSRVNTRVKTPIVEDDRHFYQISAPDNNTMLGAEILTAANQCRFNIPRSLKSRRAILIRLLKNRLRKLRNQLAIAKVAYALLVSGVSRWKRVTRKLFLIKKKTTDGLLYWSELSEDRMRRNPSFDRSDPTADAIETTSYALMLSLKYTIKRGRRKGQHVVDPDRIAGWIVRWRNTDGVFVGATDTAVATLALAKYREYKNIQNTSLQLVISNTAENFTQSLEFDDETALSIKSVPEVPPVSILHVFTRGEGLGQMHVHAKYNQYVDEEADCRFNMTVQCYLASLPLSGDFNLCSMCDIGCERKRPPCKVEDSPKEGISYSGIQRCLKISIRYSGDYDHGRTVIEANMLTGYEPVMCDLQQMTGGDIMFATFDEKKAKVTVTVRQVSTSDKLNFGFRIKKKHEVQGLHPATIIIRDPRRKVHSCTKQYDTGNDVSLSVVCSNLEPGQYRGDCQCVSGKCSGCSPSTSLFKIKHAVRNAKYVFKVEAYDVQNKDTTKVLMSTALEVKKQCSEDQVLINSTVQIFTKRSCHCPKFQQGQTYWVMGTQVYPRRKKDGSSTFHYWIDEDSFVMGDIHEDFAKLEKRINLPSIKTQRGCH